MENFPVPQVIGNSRKLAYPVPDVGRPAGVERILAHRGGAGLRPENTLSAFRQAWGMGIRVLETDVHVTSDGVAICFHDDTLDRVTDLTGRPEDYTWAELSRTSVHGPNGTSDVVLNMTDLIEEFPEAKLVIDVKYPDGIHALARAINATGSAGRICVTHAWDSWLEGLREMTSPELQRCLGWETMTSLYSAARAGHRPDPALRVANWVHVGWDVAPFGLMSDHEFAQRLVDMAHDLGLGVRVWTINDADRMARLWNQGVDAVFTDYPDVALGVLG